jgi:hypothetical protein
MCLQRYLISATIGLFLDLYSSSLFISDISNIIYPNFETIYNLKRRYCARLQDSLQYIFAELKQHFFSKILESYEARFISELSSPDAKEAVFFWTLINSHLPNWISSKNEIDQGLTLIELENYLQNLLRINTFPLSKEVKCVSLVKNSTDSISNLLASSFIDSSNWDECTQNEIAYLQTLVCKELELFQTIDLNGYKEALEASQVICFANCESLLSSSSFGTIGSVFVSTHFCNFDSKEVPCLHFLDKWIHECAHNILYMASTEEEFFEFDSSVLVKSPLRNDIRPLDGLFHQCFVLCRLVLFYMKLLENNDLKQRYNYNIFLDEISSRASNYRSLLFQGLSTLHNKVTWNKVGKNVLDQMWYISRS